MDRLIEDIRRRAGLPHREIKEMVSAREIEPQFKAAAEILHQSLMSGNDRGTEFEFRWEFKQEYARELEQDGYDIDPYEPFPEDPEWQERYDQWVMGHAEDRVRLAFDDIQRRAETNSGQIKLYRVITAPYEWISTGGLRSRGMGVFWSYDRSAAEAHWGEFNGRHIRWRLTGWVGIGDVEWDATLAQNADPSYVEEMEIRVREGTVVDVVQIEMEKNGDFVPVPDFQPMIARA